MKLVKQLLDHKGHDLWLIEPECSVLSAIELMADKEVGALPVVENGKLIGILSERDYARKVILKGRSSESTPVKSIMTTQVICTNPEQTAQQCMAVMTEKRFRHLPVVDDGRLVGIVSIGDLVRAIIAEQQFTIEQLESYING
jgi:CBS domain-containing protein